MILKKCVTWLNKDFFLSDGPYITDITGGGIISCGLMEVTEKIEDLE